MWPAGTTLNAVNAPARTIFPSGCTAISFTAPVAPAPGSKLGSKEPACGKAGRNREVKERDSSQQRTEVRNSMTGSVEHFQTSRSLRDYRASMNVRVPWRTLDGWRAQLSFGRTRRLEERTGTKYLTVGQRSTAGREQVLVQGVLAYLAAGAKFFEVSFRVQR